MLTGSYVAHLDMPLPCGLPEGKAASLLPPGDDNVVGVPLWPFSLGNSEFTCVRAMLLVSATRSDV